MGRLAGKSIVAVGCATGIGAGATPLLAREGAKLTLGDIDAAGAERTAARIRDLGGDAVALRVDMAVESEVAALIALAIRRHGRIDGLANIAAATHLVAAASAATVLDIDRDLWDRRMAINARGFLLTMRAVAPHMLEAGGGSIVNISSVGATHPQSFAGAYSASKAAVDALTTHVAAAYGKRGIRCNAIAPGPIATPENQQTAMQSYFDSMRRFVPSPRLGRPEDIGGLIAFLLSDEAGFINGEVIRVDGGALCHAPWSADVGFGTLSIG